MKDSRKAIRAWNAEVAELWGVHEWLKFSFERGYKKVKFQTDNKVISVDIKDKKPKLGSGWALLQQIRNMINRDWEVRVEHVYW